MIKRNFKLFLLLCICFFSLSCSFENMNSGKLSISLPRKVDGQSSNTEIAYNIVIVKGQKVIHDKTYSTNDITIKNIPVGLCHLSINWEDDKYLYFGESDVNVLEYKVSTAEIKITKKLKNQNTTPDEGGTSPDEGNTNPPTDVKLQSITAEQLPGKNIIINSDVTIDDFVITEKYSDNKTYKGDNKKYELEGKVPTDKLGNIKAVIKNIENQEIKAEADVHVVYDIPDFAVKVVGSVPNFIQVPQYTGSENLTLSIAPALSSSYPYDTDTKTIEWLQCDTEPGIYTAIPGQKGETFTVPNDTEGKVFYKAKVTLKPGADNAAHCLTKEKHAESEAVEVKVTPWRITSTDGKLTADGKLTSEQTYPLTVENEGTSTKPSVTWSSSNTAFDITGNTLKAPAITSSTQEAVITATANGKKIATLSVVVIGSGVTLSSIDATPNKSYILYNDTISINDFTITETFSDKSTHQGNNSNYSIEGTPDLSKLGPVQITIKNNSKPSIEVTKEIPVHYELPVFSVSLNKAKPLNIPQYTGNEIVNLTVSPTLPSSYPNDTNETVYSWLESTTASGNYTQLLGQSGESFTLPNSETGTKYYKAQVTVKPGSQNAKYCTSSQSQATSDFISVTVKPWTLSLTETSDLTNLKGNTSYTLSLTNEAGGSVPPVTWVSTNGFNIKDNTLTTPELSVGMAKSSEISAVINQGTPNEKVLAKITVQVPGKTCTSIKVALKQDQYVLYGEAVDINKFDITEVYDDGTESKLSNNSSYIVTDTSPITQIGETTVTIKNKNLSKVEKNVTIPCKYNLPDISLQINASSTPSIAVPQYTGSEELKAVLTPSTPLTAPNDTDIVTYQWQECGTKDGTYTPISSATSQNYSVPVDATGQKYYKCVATVQPSSENANFCLAPSKTATSSNAIDITVEPWSLAITEVTADKGTATVEGGKTYTLELSNKATQTLPDIKWECTSGFTVSGSTLTVPAATDTEQTGTISAIIGSGSSKKTLASISVKVPAKVKRTVTNFAQLESAVNEGAAEIILDAANITMEGTLTINKPLTITAKQNVTLTRNTNHYDSFFIIDANTKIGNGTMTITLDGNRAKLTSTGSTLLKVNENKQLSLNNCVLQNNNSGSTGGSAISNAGTCSVTNCTIKNNITSANGGGILNTAGTLNIKSSSIMGAEADINSAVNGGGIAVTGGTVTIDANTTIQNNKAINGNGGGIYIEKNGSVTNNAKMSGNTAGSGNNVYVKINGTYNGKKGEHVE